MKYYINEKTKEKVYEDDWQNYVMKHYGLTILPIGKHAELSKEQYELIDMITAWHFDDWDWTFKEEIDALENNYESVMEDKLYEENLEKRLLEG